MFVHKTFDSKPQLHGGTIRKIFKVFQIHRLGLNVCAKFHGNPSNICTDISVWTKVMDRPTLAPINTCC